jgi:hypothetical protein
MGNWVFEELRGAAVRRDPNEAVLFKTEQAGEGEYAGNDALVREILQNSVDARAGDGPVRVRLAIHDPGDAPPPPRLAYYFKRLREPLKARQVEFDSAGVPQLPCRFLVCEDFGTRGLEGDTSLFADPPVGDRSRQDFFWFWRNTGRSAKTGDDLGRWGLGKTVYRAVSRVGCMLGLAIRQSDRQRLLMGQAVLQIHRHQGKEYMPEGYWCGSQNASGLPMPIEEGAELSQFCKEWHITRTQAPGLSVVAAFVPEELKPDRVLQAVAVHFFTRILRGELIVEIVGPGLGSVVLDQHGIQDACKQVAWEGPKRTKRHVAPPIVFAKQCLRARPPVFTQLLGTKVLPTLTDDCVSEQELARLRRQFAAGEMTAVGVRVWLLRRQGAGQEGQLDVYLQRVADGTRCDAYYVREGMTITKINARAAQRGVQALVNADTGPLATLLGDTEGPAHEDWDTSADRPDREWSKWKGRVTFVRGIVDRLVELLTPPTTEPNFDLLSDFFSIERGGGGPGRKPRREPIIVHAEPKWFHITDRAGGFTVSRMTGVPMPENAVLKVSVAYDLPRGDPVGNWSPVDFRIGNSSGDLPPLGAGIKVKVLRGNVVFLTDLKEDFRFAVAGFDKHRDLFVRVDDETNSEEVRP